MNIIECHHRASVISLCSMIVYGCVVNNIFTQRECLSNYVEGLKTKFMTVGFITYPIIFMFTITLKDNNMEYNLKICCVNNLAIKKYLTILLCDVKSFVEPILQDDENRFVLFRSNT